MPLVPKLRFSLRTVFVVITVIGVVLAHCVNRIHQRERLIQLVEPFKSAGLDIGCFPRNWLTWDGVKFLISFRPVEEEFRYPEVPQLVANEKPKDRPIEHSSSTAEQLALTSAMDTCVRLFPRLTSLSIDRTVDYQFFKVLSKYNGPLDLDVGVFCSLPRGGLAALANPKARDWSISVDFYENANAEEALRGIEKIPQLRRLYLEYDIDYLEPFRLDETHLGIREVAKVAGLEQLGLYGCILRGRNMPPWNRLTHLTRLQIGWSLVDTDFINGLAELPALEYLQLEIRYDNDELNLTGLGNLPRLTTLWLIGHDHCEFGRFAQQLRSCTGLRQLNLASTEFGKRGLDTVSILPNLEVLTIDECHRNGDNRIDDDVWSILEKFPKLKHVTVSRCSKITGAGVREFVKSKNGTVEIHNCAMYNGPAQVKYDSWH
jgi:hypothetical protein